MIKRLTTFIVILCMIIPLQYSLADEHKADHEKATRLVLQFTDESGNPLQGVEINIFKQTSSSHLDFFVKEKPVDKEGRLRLPDAILPLPAGTEISVHSKDDYYFHYVKIEELSVRNGIAKITLYKTGIIAATIQKYPPKITHPVVVEAFKKNEKGLYESVRGIGIFLSFNYKFEVAGLPTGVYKIQIKDDYESRQAHFEQDGIDVVGGRKTDIGKINLN